MSDRFPVVGIHVLHVASAPQLPTERDMDTLIMCRFYISTLRRVSVVVGAYRGAVHGAVYQNSARLMVAPHGL